MMHCSPQTVANLNPAPTDGSGRAA